jgi:hypothetical protein
MTITMRYYASIAIMALCSACGAQTNTNSLCIYFVAGEVPRDQLWHGTIQAKSLKVVPKAILSSGDFKSYDRSNHVFTITAEAAKRLAVGLRRQMGRSEAPVVYASGKAGYELCGPDTPFVLFASGQPIYAGVFSFPFSSQSYLVPVILPAPAEPFVLALDSTNDVSFWINLNTIDKTYGAPADWGTPKEVLSDKRILAALDELGL